LCIPTEYGGSGAGILGLAVAIEEVAKYSNTAALMLLLTRLPTGPVMIAGTEEQKASATCPGIADGTLRAAFGLSEPQAGSDVMGMRTRGCPTPAHRRLGAQRHQVLDVGRARGRLVHRVRQDGDPTSRAHDSITAFIVERSGTASRSAAPTTRWACAASTPASCC
jgi:alkylation response protein AidB-like acyl-CoA dehydrogenase